MLLKFGTLFLLSLLALLAPVEAGFKMKANITLDPSPLLFISTLTPYSGVSCMSRSNWYRLQYTTGSNSQFKLLYNVSVPAAYTAKLVAQVHYNEYNGPNFELWLIPEQAPNMLYHVQYNQGKWLQVEKPISLLPQANSSALFTQLTAWSDDGPVTVASADVLIAVTTSSLIPPWKLWLHQFDGGYNFSRITSVMYAPGTGRMYVGRSSNTRGQIISVHYEALNGFDSEQDTITRSPPSNMFITDLSTHYSYLYWTSVEPSQTGGQVGVLYGYQFPGPGHPAQVYSLQINQWFIGEVWTPGYTVDVQYSSNTAVLPSVKTPEIGYINLRVFDLTTNTFKQLPSWTYDSYKMPTVATMMSSGEYSVQALSVLGVTAYGYPYNSIVQAWDYRTKSDENDTEGEEMQIDLNPENEKWVKPSASLHLNLTAPDGCDGTVGCTLDNRCPARPTQPLKCYGPIVTSFYCCWKDPY